MKEWWEGDNVEQVLNEGIEDVAEMQLYLMTYITPC